jgi:hypothetical protein
MIIKMFASDSRKRVAEDSRRRFAKFVIIIRKYTFDFGEDELKDLRTRRRLFVLNYGYIYGRNDVIVVDGPLEIIIVWQ